MPGFMGRVVLSLGIFMVTQAAGCAKTVAAGDGESPAAYSLFSARSIKSRMAARGLFDA